MNFTIRFLCAFLPLLFLSSIVSAQEKEIERPHVLRAAAFVLDTNPPQLTATVECAEPFSMVTATDSGESESGIAAFYVDPTRSWNVHSIALLCSPANNQVLQTKVELLNPAFPGRAVVIARDRADNADTLIVDLRVGPPSFSRAFIGIFALSLQTPRSEVIEILNRNNQPVIVKSARLASGEVIEIEGIGSDGNIHQRVEPGESYDLTLRVEIDRPAIYRDTLIVVVNCSTYRFPISITDAAENITVMNTDFGTVRVGMDKCSAIIISNITPTPVRIENVYVEQPFSLSSFSSISIAPGDQLLVYVCYSPKEKGEHIGKIWVMTDMGPISAVLRGVGTDGSSSVHDPVEQRNGSITVMRHGDILLLELSRDHLDVSTVRLVSSDGRSVQLAEAERESEGRWRVLLPSNLPSGVYYVSGNLGGGVQLLSKALIVR